MQTFEDFLREIHAGTYTGPNNHYMPDDFEKWLLDLDVNKVISYAEIWGKNLIK